MCMDNHLKTIPASLDSTVATRTFDNVRSNGRQINWWLVAGDAFGLAIAWLVSFAVLWLVEERTWLKSMADWFIAHGRIPIALVVVPFALSLLTFGMRGHYTRRRPLTDEILDIFKVFLVVAVLDGVFAYLAKWYFSRSWFVMAWVLTFLLVPCIRAGIKLILIRAHRWQRATVILGAGKNAREAAEALDAEPFMGLEIKAFLVPPGEDALVQVLEVKNKKIPVLPLGIDPDKTLESLGSPQLVVALESESVLPHQRLLQRLLARYGDLRVIPPLRGLPLYGMEITHFFSHEVLMLSMRNNLARPGPQLLKRIFDLLGSLLLLVLLAPLFAYLSWKIRQSGSKAVFGHERIGRHGKRFQCLKFRTMVPDADRALIALLESDPRAREEWEQGFKLKNDPRVTPVGDFLRRTSLDELPQLWNVLKGDMSLVGPRPIIEEELGRYGDQVGYYLETRPGITGLWQISGRNDTGYEDRVSLDSWYVRNWSLWYDFVVLLKTVRVVWRREGAY